MTRSLSLCIAPSWRGQSAMVFSLGRSRCRSERIHAPVGPASLASIVGPALSEVSVETRSLVKYIRLKSEGLNWPGLRTVFIPRSETEFGFTLRHLVVHPPPSVLGGPGNVSGSSYKDYNYLSSESSLQPLETIFVKSVKEDSPAYYAGLSPGDRIIAVNGDSVSCKSYQDVIAAIQQGGDILKLVIVSKDEDILQMAYQSQAGECLHSSSCSLTNNTRLAGVNSYLPHHQYSHSSSDLASRHRDPGLAFSSIENLPYDRHEVRHSYPLSQWGHNGTDFRFEDFGSDLHFHRAEPFLNQVVAQRQQQRIVSQDPALSMASNVTCSIPCKPKFSFGIYYPPKPSEVVSGSSSRSTGGSHTNGSQKLSSGFEDSPIQPSSMTRSHTFDANPVTSLSLEKSLNENSTLSSSARSRDYFIRYSSDKAASDNRNRYSPRHSAYERNSYEIKPAYFISRSQTESTISPLANSGAGQQQRQSLDHLKSSKENSINLSRSHQHISEHSANKQPRNEDYLNKGSDVSGNSQSSVNSEQSDPKSESRTYMMRIPNEQQTQQLSSVVKSSYTPVRHKYGVNHTRSHSATHTEIHKSIGQPIVSQRKYQFESGKNENTSAPSIGAYNRYKTEIEKIRTQPKFSSIALRKASFEQSPDRDPPLNDAATQPPADESGLETAQPTVKVRKISAERYSPGRSQVSGDNDNKSNNCEGGYSENVSARIPKTSGNVNAQCSPNAFLSTQGLNQVSSETQVLSKNTKTSKDSYLYGLSKDNMADTNNAGSGGCDISIGSLSDSGVWVKSYHGSSDMLDSVDGVSGVSDSGLFSVCGSAVDHEIPSQPTPRPARKPSYLSAVNAPVQRSSTHSLSSVSSGTAPFSCSSTSVMSASDSAVMLGHTEDNQDSADPVFGGNSGASVIMRKKLQESLEEQANKLHRRTSYLMATARDRTNMVPLEGTFSSPQVITDHSPQHVMLHISSVKLNKFFGEMIPTIAEGVEMKCADHDELPEIIRKGPLQCKISVIEGKKCSDRSWKSCYAVLRPTELFLTRDKESGMTSSNFEDQHIPLKLCMVEFARDYAKKKKSVFRMSTHNECEYLFQTEDRGTLMGWIQGIKSINEPMKAEKMEEILAFDKEKHSTTEGSTTPRSKMSPQLGHKGKKLSALSFKSKLTSSPSMKRKKPNTSEKDKDESGKKGWMDRLPMMKSLKKHSDDSGILSQAEQNLDTDKFQFGVPLEDCFPSPNNEYVPLIVELCTRIVEARGLEVVGVYRVPGNSAAVNALTEEFNRGIDSVNIDNEKLLDINVISSLLKSFFRKLPEPLIPSDVYDAFIEANRCPDESKRKLKLKQLIFLLPPHHNKTFKHMAEHLNKVASYGHINKMDAKNLAIMFGPTLVRKKGDDTVSLVTDMSDQCRIVESIILHHDWFFSPCDQDNYIPMETTVETVPVDDGQVAYKDDDGSGLNEEADSAISTKEIISSIVNAASKKLRQQQQKSLESLCSTVSTSTYRGRSSNDSVHTTSLAKSLASITSSFYGSEEYLENRSPEPSNRHMEMLKAGSGNELDFKKVQHPNSKGPIPPSFVRYQSDKSDELEISHGLSTSHDAINRLKRIGDDVSALLHTFEQKQLKEREHRRREQEMVEREHLRTQLELEQEENHSVDDWLEWKGNIISTRMPDLVSSSYIGEKFPSDHKYSNVVLVNQENNDKQLKKLLQNVPKQKIECSGQALMKNVPYNKTAVIPTISLPVEQYRISRAGSHENILNESESQEESVVMRRSSQRKLQDNSQTTAYLAVGGIVHRPPSVRNSLGRRHASLDSLIDMIDKQDQRASWASTDSEDGSDLLTSITTTFDQKLQILLNPRYKLTGTGRRSTKIDTPSSTNEGAFEWDSLWPNESFQARPPAVTNPRQAYTVAALLDSGSFRDPSLHRSARSDPKIGIASRFERNDTGRATSSSPVTTSFDTAPNYGQLRRNHMPDFKTFLGKPVSQIRELNSVILTKPKKLETSSNKTSVVHGKYEKKTGAKSGNAERYRNLSPLNKEKLLSGENSLNSKVKLKERNGEKRLERRHSYRRHTIGGLEDITHLLALSQVSQGSGLRTPSPGRDKISAWEQLQPVMKDSGMLGTRNVQAWIQRERLRGSTPDLSYSQNH